MMSRGRGNRKREGGSEGGTEGRRRGGCEQWADRGVVGNEGGEVVREGEGVVGLTYCIQPWNDDIIIFVDNLWCMDAMSLTGAWPNTCWWLVVSWWVLMLINGVSGHSWMIIGGGWVLVVLGRCIHSLMVVGDCHAAKGVSGVCGCW